MSGYPIRSYPGVTMIIDAWSTGGREGGRRGGDRRGRRRRGLRRPGAGGRRTGRRGRRTRPLRPQRRVRRDRTPRRRGGRRGVPRQQPRPAGGIPMRNGTPHPRREAWEILGGEYDVRVLEPSPPAVDEPPWYADA